MILGKDIKVVMCITRKRERERDEVVRVGDVIEGNEKTNTLDSSLRIAKDQVVIDIQKGPAGSMISRWTGQAIYNIFPL
jgi:hypothetical protein